MSNKSNNVVVPVIPEKVKKEDNKMEKKNIMYIGIGAAGNKAAAALVAEKVATEDQVALLNSTDKDFPEWFKGSKIVMSPDNNGCGKEREVSKRYAMSIIQSGQIDRVVEGAEKVVIVASLEGGTGSGSAPIIGRYCVSVLGKNVRIFGFAGFEDDARGMQNTVEFFQSIDFECSVQCIRNKSFMSGNKFDAEDKANKEFCQEMRVLSGQDLIASTQNMDNTDLDKVTNTLGYCIVDKIVFNKPLMDEEDFNKLCKQMTLRQKDMPSEYGQIRLGVILNIKPESEGGIDYSFKVLKDTYGHPYEHFIHKQYDGGEQYIAYIATGMKLPLDEVKGIYDRYVAASAAVNKEHDNFFDEIGNMKRVDDSRFDIGTTNKATTSKEDFLRQFSGAAAVVKK